VITNREEGKGKPPRLYPKTGYPLGYPEPALQQKTEEREREIGQDWGKPIYSKLSDFCPMVLWYEITHDIIIPPEVHDLLLCYQMRTETRPQATYTINLMKFSHVVFKLCMRTDRQTHSQTYSSQHFATLKQDEVKSINARQKSTSFLFNYNNLITITICYQNSVKRCLKHNSPH